MLKNNNVQSVIQKPRRTWVDALDIYSQYFHAHCNSRGSERRAALVRLTALKDAEGVLAYQISASFMPFEDEEDFRVPNDVLAERIVHDGMKKRAKKKEEELLSVIRDEIDALLPSLRAEAEIFWDRPLRDARYA
ncbi:MAG: hypothetical protein IIY46_02810 [Lachnospiraceae bacterium]|nr:hypothetical protein [Lachnospiraceae bacterium]